MNCSDCARSYNHHSLSGGFRPATPERLLRPSTASWPGLLCRLPSAIARDSSLSFLVSSSQDPSQKGEKKKKNPKHNFHQGSSRPHGTCGSQNETLAWSGQGLRLGPGAFPAVQCSWLVFSRKLPQASMTQEQKPLARFLWSAFCWDPSPEISTVIAGQGNRIIS